MNRWLFALYCCAATVVAPAQNVSGLNKKEFAKYWRVESESKDYKVSFRGDTAEIVAPKGLTAVLSMLPRSIIVFHLIRLAALSTFPSRGRPWRSEALGSPKVRGNGAAYSTTQLRNCPNRASGTMASTAMPSPVYSQERTWAFSWSCSILPPWA